MQFWTRRLASAAVAAGLVASALTANMGAVSAAPSASGSVSNPYSPAYGHPYRHGVVPTVARQRQMQTYTSDHPSTVRTATGPETLSYGGGIDGTGVTSGTPKVYLVFWGTQWGTQSTDGNGNLTFSNDPSGGAPYLQQLFKGLGTGNELWSGTMTQYCDGPSVTTGATSCPAGAPHIGYPTGGALAGVWYDNSAAEPTTANGNQLAVESVNAAGHFGNNTAAKNRYAQYVILSATGLNPDGYRTGGFCAWHDYNGDTTLTGGAANSPYGDIAFTNMPYVMDQGTSCGKNFVNSPGTLDGYSIVEGHEYAETITDQNPAGGWTNRQNNSYTGQENGDECAWISSGQGASANVSTGRGNFAMQSTWSNDTNRCDLSHTVVSGTTTNDFSISASPQTLTVAQGASGSSTISTIVTSGSAGTVNLTSGVSPSGPTASLNPTSVTAGGSSTLSVTVGTTVATGTYTVTVSGTEGSASHSTTVTVNVTAPVTNDLSITASPQTLTVAQGASGSSTISTIVTSGSAGTVNLTSGVSPSGPTASLNPTSVTAGGSSTLSVTVGTTVATGTYTVTVSGTEGSASHSTTVAVNVTSAPPPTGGITNGGFETGSFSGWTTSGATSIVSSGQHSGSFAAQAGSTGPTNGDSNIAQTFTAPSGVTGLSFWYKMTCPDTVTYDWSTATLKDNTAGTSNTLLPKTCATSASWVQVSGTVTAGHSYTLTLTSHDDNYSSDPTYTRFDDVSLTSSAPPPSGGITNGGFETGSFSGWTTSGATSIVSSGQHGGSFAAQAGSTGPTNGDSNIAQTFTATTGTSKLSFWYKMTCPDTVTYDWSTATLKDNTASTSNTLLPKTCATSASWVQVSGTVTAGHSYTLTLTSHDDNYSNDPSFTLFDDVALQ